MTSVLWLWFCCRHWNYWLLCLLSVYGSLTLKQCHMWCDSVCAVWYTLFQPSCLWNKSFHAAVIASNRSILCRRNCCFSDMETCWRCFFLFCSIILCCVTSMLWFVPVGISNSYQIKSQISCLSRTLQALYNTNEWSQLHWWKPRPSCDLH